MCGRAGIILLAILATISSLDASTSLAIETSAASSETKFSFDLSAESLDKALRDFAVQAHCDISYEPSIVAGLQSPAINGKFTVGRVLSLLLRGTRLRAVNVNENTIQILENPQSTPLDATSAPSGHSPHGVVHAGTDVPTPSGTSSNFR
jgi:outer membrane receptor for ferric coprogen and ferric-rhodotorulic acid